MKKTYKKVRPTSVRPDGTTDFGFEEVGGSGVSSSHFVRGDIESFRSPLTGEVISSRSALREHERRTGQTNDLDSLREQTQRASNKNHVDNSPETRHQRKLAIKDTIERLSSSGYRRPHRQ